ncbi:MAG: hypothetical protein O2960_17425, partial [Verrucomicrobia bacterium]|nr:hypothetical protein [Verrucomicrobiota bacterium]
MIGPLSSARVRAGTLCCEWLETAPLLNPKKSEVVLHNTRKNLPDEGIAEDFVHNSPSHKTPHVSDNKRCDRIIHCHTRRPRRFGKGGSPFPG